MPKTKDAPEVIEAEAEIIEEGIAPISGLDALIGEIAAEAESIAAEYLPHDIADEDDFRQSKRERTGARKSIAALKARYAEKMGAVKDAVAQADLRMKAAIDPLDSIDKGYKLKVDEYTTRWTNRRIATLREAYEDFAPDLALPQEGADKPLVPFHRIIGRYGNEKGAQWTSRSVGETKATEAMYAAVEEIAKAEKTIDRMVEEAYREGAKARYFRTLDLQATLNEEAEAKEQRERVARLEAERREREAAQAAAQAAEEQRAAEDAWLRQMTAEPAPENVVRIVAPPSDELQNDTAEREAYERGPVPAPEQMPTPEPMPTAPTFEPAPIAPPAPPTMPEPAEIAHAWVVFIPSASRTQVLALRDWLNANGMTGGKVYSGNVRDAYMKELSNANGQ